MDIGLLSCSAPNFLCAFGKQNKDAHQIDSPLQFARKLRMDLSKGPPPPSALLHWISDSVLFQMLFPVLLAIQGTVGAVYCVVISSLGLLSGPLCDTGSGNYTYPFRNYSLEWVAFMALGPCLTSKDDTVMTTKSVCSENWLCSSGARYLHSYLVSCSSLCTRLTLLFPNRQSLEVIGQGKVCPWMRQFTQGIQYNTLTSLAPIIKHRWACAEGLLSTD